MSLPHRRHRHPEFMFGLQSRRHPLLSPRIYHHYGVTVNPIKGVPRANGSLHPPSAYLDDDPGVMSEVETSSTGFRRGSKPRASLPVVRTPSKTLERPLGMVFLQYRMETKRSLLPNEITSLDTVKALFVRAFPKNLTLQYLDNSDAKIYIHDSSKDMFYELDDLRDIKDRSVLRIMESEFALNGPGMDTMSASNPTSSRESHWDDTSYFSEPEFDGDYSGQHVHRSKNNGSKTLSGFGGSLSSLNPPVGAAGPPAAGTLPPPKPQRMMYSSMNAPANTLAHHVRVPRDPSPNVMGIPAQRSSSGESYLTSPERTRSFTASPYLLPNANYDGDPFYQLPYRSVPPPPHVLPPPPAAALLMDNEARKRVENMERQLASLTGMVAQALNKGPATTSSVATPSSQQFLNIPAGSGHRDAASSSSLTSPRVLSPSPFSTTTPTTAPPTSSVETPPPRPPRTLAPAADDSGRTPRFGRAGKDKSVSFEKSVSFSDDPPDLSLLHTKSHSTKPPDRPAKPAIKSSTLPRNVYSQQDSTASNPSQLSTNLRYLQKKTRTLRQESILLRRMTENQSATVNEMIRDISNRLRSALLSGMHTHTPISQPELERIRILEETSLYRHDMQFLEGEINDLDINVETLRSDVINKRARVNPSDVEEMALQLSKASKTVSELKNRFPPLQDRIKRHLGVEMERIVKEEKFLREEPDRLDTCLRRCKKLTGTLVTLKRLASVQEHRLLPALPSADPHPQPPAPAPPEEPLPPPPSLAPPSVPAATAASAAEKKGPTARGEGRLSGGVHFGGVSDSEGARIVEGRVAMTALPIRGIRRLPSFPSSDSAPSPVRSSGRVLEEQHLTRVPVPRPYVPPPPPRTTSSLGARALPDEIVLDSGGSGSESSSSQHGTIRRRTAPLTVADHRYLPPFDSMAAGYYDLKKAGSESDLRARGPRAPRVVVEACAERSAASSARRRGSAGDELGLKNGTRNSPML
ncbi:unnamed protein product [Cyprideis torosa]|uniref:Actin interacting protein 3-like C-terminal domain-containing protein n=1 Tax=Cyprideis torosa TaxID=163714 RepID=A0A7R8W2V5_9CRUS|nr:unnamed protein product [Cyprideis torosa]CAG0882252.1 unnamed protein product [Cyprideis torosa]